MHNLHHRQQGQGQGGWNTPASVDCGMTQRHDHDLVPSLHACMENVLSPSFDSFVET